MGVRFFPLRVRALDYIGLQAEDFGFRFSQKEGVDDSDWNCVRRFCDGAISDVMVWGFADVSRRY